MIIKRITAFLVIALLVSFTFVSCASSFTDVADDYWAKDYIEKCQA